jgi:NADPH-dependent curcumin reductase CurA
LGDGRPFTACSSTGSNQEHLQKEDVAVGLEHAPPAFMRLFTGENFGKQLVKITDAAA